MKEETNATLEESILNARAAVGRSKSSSWSIWKKIVVGIGIFWLVAMVALVSDGDVSGNPGQNTSPVAAQPQADPRPDLEVLNVTREETRYGRAYLTGTIKNNTDQDYDYVQLEISFYATDGKTKIGDALTNTMNLGPGETWKFSTSGSVEQDQFVYRVAEVSGH